MFGGFNLMDKLWPVDTFLNAIGNAMCLDKTTYNFDEAKKEIKAKGETELKNVRCKVDSYNRSFFASSKICIKSLEYESIFLRFPKTYIKEGTVIRLEGVNLDLYASDEIKPQTGGKGKAEEMPLEKLINNVVAKITFEVKRLRVRIFVNDNLSYCVMIKRIGYDKTPGKSEIESKDKMKYLFCHNKSVCIENIVIKENPNDEDKIFFTEEKNKVKFYTSKDLLFVLDQIIQLDITYDYEKHILKIENKLENVLNIESIIGQQQVKNLMVTMSQFSGMPTQKAEIGEVEVEEKKEPEVKEQKKDEKEQKEQKELKVLGYSISTISFGLNINDFTFILVNDKNTQAKPKFWLIYKEYFSKYCDLPNDNKISLIQRHFCYLDEIFYLFYIEKPTLKFGKDFLQAKGELSTELTSLTGKMIQPNKVENKKNIIIINNSSTNAENNSEKTFNDMFMNYYMKIVKYSYYTHNFFSGYNIKTENTQILFDTFNLEINILIIKKIKDFFDSTQIEQPSKEIQAQKDKSNEEKKKKNLSIGNFGINGNINIKFIVNKRSSKYMKNESKPIESDYYLENIVLSIVNLEVNGENGIIKANYKKTILWYFIGSIAYPFIVHYQKDKSSFKDMLTITLKDSFTFSCTIEKIVLFSNSFLLKNIFLYTQLFIRTLSLFKSKEKEDTINITEQSNSPLKFLQYTKYLSLFSIKEILVIPFGNISLKSSHFEMKKINAKNESIFKFIQNPILKLTISNISFNNNKIEIDDINALVHKQDNTFQNELLVYQAFITDKNNNNFEYVLYSSDKTQKICTIDLSEDKISISLCSFTLCVFNRFLDEILVICEHSKRELIKMSSYISTKYPSANANIDLTGHDKIKPKEEHLPKNNINILIEVSIKQMFFDVYSLYKKKYGTYYGSFSSNNAVRSYGNMPLSQADRVRLIFLLNTVLLKFISKDNISLSIASTSLKMIKDLEVHPDTTSLLKVNVDNFLIGNSSWKKIGFANMFNSNEISFVYLGDSKNNDIVLQDLVFDLCEDSLKYTLGIVEKLKKDMQNVQNLFNYLEDDKENIMTEVGHIQEKFLIEQLKNRGIEQSGIEFRSVGRAYSDIGNKMHFKFGKGNSSIHSGNSSKNSNKVKMKKEEVLESPLPKQEQLEIINTDKVKGKKYKFALSINSIQINLHNGEDFNFQGKYIADQYLDSDNNNNETAVENINPRIEDIKINFNIQNVNIKVEIAQNHPRILSLFSLVQSIIIEDYLPESKYKKILSHFDFNNPCESFLTLKFDIIKSQTGNGENDINALIELCPIAIYLDQNTLEFILYFFDLANANSNVNNLNDSFHQIIQNDTNQIVENEISTVNYSQYKARLFDINISMNPENFYFQTLKITQFFISFNYFARKFNPDNYKGLSKETKNALGYLSMSSINDMKIEFKEYIDENRIKAKKIPNELYIFYKNDILNNQAISSYAKSLPAINGLCHVLDGIFDLAKIPYDSYKANIPIEDGMVNGVRKFVVTTSTELLSFGESVAGFFKCFCCNPDNNSKNIRDLRYRVDEESKKRDDYYLK